MYYPTLYQNLKSTFDFFKLTTEISNYRLSRDDERMCEGTEVERSGCYLIQLCIIREIVTLTFGNDLNHKPADILCALQRIAIAWEDKNQCLYLERMRKQLLTTLILQWFVFYHCQTNRAILLPFDSENDAEETQSSLPVRSLRRRNRTNTKEHSISLNRRTRFSTHSSVGMIKETVLVPIKNGVQRYKDLFKLHRLYSL